jgi:hypothetical protein
MLSEWIMGEHHRLHIVEEWPDGPYKEAVLAAIRSTLDSLLLDFRAAVKQPVCAICRNRRRATASSTPLALAHTSPLTAAEPSLSASRITGHRTASLGQRQKS